MEVKVLIELVLTFSSRGSHEVTRWRFLRQSHSPVLEHSLSVAKATSAWPWPMEIWTKQRRMMDSSLRETKQLCFVSEHVLPVTEWVARGDVPHGSCPCPQLQLPGQPAPGRGRPQQRWWSTLAPTAECQRRDAAGSEEEGRAPSDLQEKRLTQLGPCLTVQPHWTATIKECGIQMKHQTGQMRETEGRKHQRKKLAKTSQENKKSSCGEALMLPVVWPRIHESQLMTSWMKAAWSAFTQQLQQLQ